MTPSDTRLEFRQGQNDKTLWRVWRSDRLVGKIDIWPDGGKLFQSRNDTPVFTLAELSQITEFM